MNVRGGAVGDGEDQRESHPGQPGECSCCGGGLVFKVASDLYPQFGFGTPVLPRDRRREAKITRQAHQLVTDGEDADWLHVLAQLQAWTQDELSVAGDRGVDTFLVDSTTGEVAVYQAKRNFAAICSRCHQEPLLGFLGLMLTAVVHRDLKPSSRLRVSGAAVAAVRDAAVNVLAEAVDVRDSIVCDDPATSRERLARFAVTYLGIDNPARVEAVGAALLHLPLAPDDPGGDYGRRTDDLLTDLSRETRRQRRALKRITDTQLFGRPVTSLDGPPLTTDPGAFTLGEVVACIRPRPDALPGLGDEFEDSRIKRILSMLSPVERLVAEEYTFGGGITWAEAAAKAGAPERYGERVSRKLRRLGTTFMARLATAGQLRSAA